MPRITLKKGQIQLPGQPVAEITTLELITRALEGAPQEGLGVQEILARGRVDRKLDKVTAETEFLDLSDSDFETLRKAFEPVRFVGRFDVINSLIEELNPEEETVSEEPIRQERELFAV